MKKIISLLTAGSFVLAAHAAESKVNLDEMSVTASTIDDRFSNPAMEISTVNVIDGNRVEKIAPKNIGEVLRSVPGVNMEMRSGGSIKIHLRGIDNQFVMGEKPGVAIVVDGVPVQERSGRVSIDVNNIESIKVIKGSASYLYGDDALSGAVIITTKRPKKDSVSASAQNGSYGYEKYRAAMSKNFESSDMYLQVTDEKNDEYWDNGGYTVQALNGKYHYYLDASSNILFGADVTNKSDSVRSGSVTGATEAKENPTAKGIISYMSNSDTELRRYFVTYSKDMETGANLMLNLYTYQDHYLYDMTPIDTNSDGVEDAYGQNRDYYQDQNGFKGEYRETFGSFAAMVGGDFRRNSERSRNEQINTGVTTGFVVTAYQDGNITGDTELKEAVNALYGEAKYQISDALIASLNGRYDSIEYDYEDRIEQIKLDKGFVASSYRLGLNFTVDQQTALYTNASVGFRVPTVSQIFYGDLSGPTDRYGTPLVNNTEIDPEKNYNYEVGFRSGSTLLHYSMALYRMERKGMISRSGGTYGGADPDGAATMYDNIADAVSQGVELSVGSDSKKALFFDLAYTYLDAYYTDYQNFNLQTGAKSTLTTTTYDLKDKKVPRSPAHVIDLFVNVRPIQEILLTAELYSQSEYYADELNWRKIPGHELVNLKATYGIKAGDYAMEFFAKVDNALDRTYYLNAVAWSDRDGDGDFDKEDMTLWVAPPRTYTVGLDVKF